MILIIQNQHIGVCKHENTDPETFSQTYYVSVNLHNQWENGSAKPRMNNILQTKSVTVGYR